MTTRVSPIRVSWALCGILLLAACGASHGAGGAGGTGSGTGGGGTTGDGGHTADGASPVMAQSLPIEVLGPDGTTATVTLPSLSAAQAAAISLQLQVHALNFPGKATVQVNAKDPLVLANPSVVAGNDYDGVVPGDAGSSTGANAILNPDVTIDQPGWSYGGIGGAFATLSLSVKLPAGSARRRGQHRYVHFSPDVRLRGGLDRLSRARAQPRGRHRHAPARPELLARRRSLGVDAAEQRCGRHRGR